MAIVGFHAEETTAARETPIIVVFQVPMPIPSSVAATDTGLEKYLHHKDVIVIQDDTDTEEDADAGLIQSFQALPCHHGSAAESSGSVMECRGGEKFLAQE